MTRGLQAFQRGRFEQAVQAFAEEVRLYGEADLAARQSDGLSRLAEAYQSLGRRREALGSLEQALGLVEPTGDQARIAAILDALGNAYLLTGALDQAGTALKRGLAMARKTGNVPVEASILNTWGNLSIARQHYEKAHAAFAESLRLARQTGEHTLAIKALDNAARLSLQTGDTAKTPELLETARATLSKLGPSHFKAYALIDLGQLARQLRDLAPAPSSRWRLFAYRAYKEAAEIAEDLEDGRAESFALGYLGGLYEEEGRHAEALDLSRRAAFAAQRVPAPESLYLWQWQTGRLLKAGNDIAGAVLAYRQAVYTLESIRQDFSSAHPGRPVSFREAVGAAYLELADLLLRHPAPENRQTELIEARETVERLKAAELRDYFQDECMTALQSRTVRLDRPPPRSAVLYPVLLPDRTELLLSLAGGMKQFTVPVGADEMTQEVRSLRRYLEKRTTREFLPHAQKLYRWLITPLEAELTGQQITTLILVPDGALRTIPMAALHDGQEFLINKFALATTPGLTLTDLRPIRRDSLQLLLAGLTDPVQGFSALPYVSMELQAIHALYAGKRLQDREFLIPVVERELVYTPYSILHIASHGQFASDPQKTFLLAYDGRLTMDRLGHFMGLSQFREQPVELLTLSACQTAAGDDRAALGLAGIAVKAGARSALASLWLINDQATALMVAEFYRRLKEVSVSKAEALRQAQLMLLKDPRYRHPGYWAPFLLIGNWL